LQVELLASEHVWALISTAGVGGVLVAAARARPGRWIAPASRGLGVAILAAYLLDHAAYIAEGRWTVERNLPLQLTDAVTIVSALALWTARPLFFELTYFWALSASLQAVLTPDLGQGFPSVFFWTYFLTHSGAVVAAAFLAWGRRMAPRSGAVGRTFLITAAFASVVGICDVLLGANYMYLREKPRSASLLDLMGPWPWYIVSGAGLGLGLFLLLDAPFRRARRAPGPPAARPATRTG
jgi:hypothetical integral membrane protein (TIGR02206 family)